MPVSCTECGAPLASGVLPDGVVTVGEVAVPFRRETDFLLCQRCLATYRVEDVRDGLPRPV
ncbi:MAG TPA: hypothetical protein VFZ45_06730 [Actinomycetota bacterium]|nr:hypothetical protein [Actinomycetota bacterium]